MVDGANSDKGKDRVDMKKDAADSSDAVDSSSLLEDDSDEDSDEKSAPTTPIYNIGKKPERRVSFGGRKTSYAGIPSYPMTSSRTSFSEKQFQIHISLTICRKKKCVTGNVLEVSGIPGNEVTGPTKIQVLGRLLPVRRVIFRSKWTPVFAKRALLMEEFKGLLSASSNKKEKFMRLRVYGDKKCLGECYVDIDECELNRGGTQKVWVKLVQARRKSKMQPLQEVPSD